MTDDNNTSSGQGQVVVFQRPKLDVNGYYSKDDYEDIFYKEVIVNGKPAFQSPCAQKYKII
jgi:hypothetical protein